jgi:hypothetical protein
MVVDVERAGALDDGGLMPRQDADGDRPSFRGWLGIGGRATGQRTGEQTSHRQRSAAAHRPLRGSS